MLWDPMEDKGRGRRLCRRKKGTKEDRSGRKKLQERWIRKEKGRKIKRKKEEGGRKKERGGRKKKTELLFGFKIYFMFISYYFCQKMILINVQMASIACYESMYK